MRRWKLGPSLTLLEKGQIYTILSSVSGSVLYLQNKDNGDKNMNFKIEFVRHKLLCSISHICSDLK